MRFLLLLFVILLTGICSAGQLITNPTLGDPKEFPANAVNFLSQAGVSVQCAKFPYRWTVTLKNKQDQLSGAELNYTASRISINSGDGELVLYNLVKIPLDQLSGDSWKLRVTLSGSGTAQGGFYCYNKQQKFQRIQLLDVLPIPQKQTVLDIGFDPKDISGKYIRAALIIKGKVEIAKVELLPVGTVEAVTELVNGSFETLDGWILKKHDGAEGRIELADGGRTGEKSLRILKSNGKGFLQLINTTPVKTAARKKYVFRGYFHTVDSMFDSLLLFRVTQTADDQFFKYDSIDRSAGYPSQSLLRNANPGQWHKRLVNYQRAEDSEVFLNLILTGNPVEVRLDDLEFTEYSYRRETAQNLEERRSFPFTREEVYKILKQRRNSEAYLKRNGNFLSIVLDDKPVIPAFYKSETYHDAYIYNRYTEFGQAGIPFAVRTVQLSSVKSEPGIVKGPGQYNFELLEEVLMYALRQNPHANLVVELNLNEPYPGWGEKHPDELWRNEKGQFGYGFWGNCQGFVNNLNEIKFNPAEKKGNWHPWAFASYSSESYRQAHLQAIADIVRHLANSPLSKAIVGYHIAGGHDAQFQYFRPDHSKAATAALREYLQKHYQTISELNKVYGSNYRDFNEIQVPLETRRSQDKEPVKNGLHADYRLFQRTVSWNLKHEFARAIRGNAGKKIFISAYGMPPEYSAEVFCRDQEGVELFAVAAYYPFRLPGYPLGAKPAATFALHDKMWLEELDLRSWTSHDKGEHYDMWISTALTPEEFSGINRKCAGIALAHHSAYWYFSMYRYFDQPELMKEISESGKAAAKIIATPVNLFCPDVCVVITESGSDTLTGKPYPIDKMLTNYPLQYQQLEISGVPYDLHSLEDVSNKAELQDYKMYVFLHTSRITGMENHVINQLKNKADTLVFVHTSGYLDEHGVNLKQMSELTGFTIDTNAGFQRATAVLEPDIQLTSGLNPMISIGELAMSNFSLSGASPFHSRYQVFRIRDAKDHEVLARYTDGSVAAAMKQTQTGRIIYSAPPFSMTAGLFHRLARQAGAYTVGEPGQSIAMNGNFISLHGTRNEKYTINLPYGVNCVEDAFTGKILARDAHSFSVNVNVGETRWFILSKPEK